ncbi:DUF2637 domain-containing protein [Nocardia sp. NPDC004568]|uniref:DUF2637 domain-containing protein n=1 Tax=Nocardia sp. NPDC004568 TaxID=3154551 RepID=UPI0033B92637
MSAVQKTQIGAVTEARLRALKVSKWCARLLVAGAFALSAVALTELATNAHIPWWLAWIWPVVIDGSIYQWKDAGLVIESPIRPVPGS